MSKKDTTIKNLKAEMQKDYDKFVTDFTSNLKVLLTMRLSKQRNNKQQGE